jgi:hypothetical protein
MQEIYAVSKLGHNPKWEDTEKFCQYQLGDLKRQGKNNL